MNVTMTKLNRYYKKNEEQNYILPTPQVNEILLDFHM